MILAKKNIYTYLWLLVSFGLIVLNLFKELKIMVLYGIIPLCFFVILYLERKIDISNKSLNQYLFFLIWSSIGVFYGPNLDKTINYLSILLGNVVLWYSIYRFVTEGASNVKLLLLLCVSMFYHIYNGVVTPVEVVEKLGYGRATGMFTNSNALGFMMWYSIVSCTFLIYLIKKRLIWKAALLGVIGLCIWILLSSGSRKSAIAVVIFGFTFLFLISKSTKKILALGGIGVLSLIYISFGEQLLGATALGQRIDADNVERSGEHRFELISEGVTFFVNNPLLGIGLGSFTYYSEHKKMAHNDYIEVLASTGLFGFLIYILLYYFFYKNNRVLMKHEDTHKLGALLQAFLVGFLFLNMGRPAFLDPVAIMIFAFFHSLSIKNIQTLKLSQ